ncbi:hypothetical protein LPU83_3090 [Rhizobium favelukesii]|uniref:Uncharacterized protein n=1 Tax=Rhizobium favelukesii TaxID=348824 RepID=W6REJ8_9HYPH|nr:hypothetical protein LPU83_3090 [Rhizobium favelukesii]
MQSWRMIPSSKPGEKIVCFRLLQKNERHSYFGGKTYGVIDHRENAESVLADPIPSALIVFHRSRPPYANIMTGAGALK